MAAFHGLRSVRRPRPRRPRPPAAGHPRRVAGGRHRAGGGAQPGRQRGGAEALRPGAPGDRRGLPDGPFTRRPVPRERPHRLLAGVPHARGSRFFADTPPATADSEHVARLRRAGLVFFGRTSTCELGLSLTCEPQLYGPTRNPWDPTRISGGSSGGAAAAVGRPHPAHGARQRRFRLHPGPGGLLRRGRAQAHPRPQHLRAHLRRGAGRPLDRARGDPDRARLRRAARRDRGPGAGRPLRRAAARPPLPPGSGARPGALRIAWTARTPNARRVERESLAALADAVKLCADLGHRVEEADPEVDGAAIVPTFLTCHRQHRGERPASTDGGPEAARGRGGARDMADRPAGGEHHRRRLRAGHPDRPPARPPDGRLSRAPRRALDPRPGPPGASSSAGST